MPPKPIHPNSLKALEPYRFRAGGPSANPGGRPRSQRPQAQAQFERAGGFDSWADLYLNARSEHVRAKALEVLTAHAIPLPEPGVPSTGAANELVDEILNAAIKDAGGTK